MERENRAEKKANGIRNGTDSPVRVVADAEKGDAGVEKKSGRGVESQPPVTSAALLDPKAYPTWRDLLAMLGVLALGTLFGALLAALLLRVNGISQGMAMFAGYVVQFASAIGFALWLKIVRGGGRPLLRFSLRYSSPTLVLWGVILTFSMSVVIEPLLELFPEEQFAPLQQLVGMGGWMMLTSVVVAPVMEEIFFRGILQESITRKRGPIVGVLITSTIFAAAHYTVPPQALNAFCVSLVLGYVYARSGSLVPVILIHAINNAIAWFTMVLQDGRIETTKTLIGDETVYRIIYGAAVVLIAAACVHIGVLLYRMKRGGEVSEDNKLNA